MGAARRESFLGEALKGRKRDSYVLATKVFGQMSDTDQGLSAEQIAKQMDASLQRLKTDYVDLYQCHRYDPNTPLEETMEALTKVVKEGKARYIGFKRMVAAEHSGRAGADGSGEVRLEPTAIFAALPPSRGQGDSRSARRTAFPRLSGRRWRKAC